MESDLAHTQVAEKGDGKARSSSALETTSAYIWPSFGALRLFWLLAIIGGATFAVGLAISPERVWANFLLMDYFLLGLGLAALFFLALQYVTGACWSVVLRRVPEAMSSTLPFAALGLAMFLLLKSSLYPWTQISAEAGHTGLGFREFWLDLPFFLGRSAIYLAIWIFFIYAIVRNSRRQDSDGEFMHSKKNIRLSALSLIFFSVTLWLASYDWIMSLEPEWYSTIFGVYNFAGLFLSGLAVIIILVVWLDRRGPLRNIINEEHYHSLGKLLFAFSTFWMYIWFSQYLLIWYANFPEETSYFIKRLHGGWQTLFILNMILNWAIPFIFLLRRPAKRNARALARVAIVVVVGRWLDLYIMILPPLSAGEPSIGVWEIGMMAGGIGVFALLFIWLFSKASPIPVNDPKLSESMNYQP